MGSLNPVKLEAVRMALSGWNLFGESEIFAVEVSSGIRAQPLGMEETTLGALNRAQGAAAFAPVGFGLEDGLLSWPDSSGCWVNICVCAVVFGQERHLGLSSGFEIPDDVARVILDEGTDLGEALKKSGRAGHRHVGKEQGAVGLFSNGRLDRREYAAQAVRCALITLCEGWRAKGPAGRIES
ncbi:MAG: DUF84 family protein [Planctomycetes bacterium]|nr:DUF84 family protein [Planctomycetota bacterium]